MDDLLNIIKGYELQIIYTVIDKISNQAKLHPHQLAFLAKENSLGLLIADENEDIEQRIIDDLERFKTVDTGFGYRPTKAVHVVDSIHFVKSNNNHLIQLADVVAYVLLRGKKVREELTKTYLEQKPSLDWDTWINQTASLRHKTELRHVNLLASRPFIYKEFP
jgi:hypothetical protein